MNTKASIKIIDTSIKICLMAVIIHSIYVYNNYNKNIELYEVNSAPWYTDVIISSVIALIIIVGLLVIKFILNSKSKSK